MFRTLLTDLGGRTFLTVNSFAVVAMIAATILVFTLEGFTSDHWIDALEKCALLVGAWISKRAVEEIGGAIKARGKA